MNRRLSWRYYVIVASTSLFLAVIACNAPTGGNITPTAPTEEGTPLLGTPTPTTEGETPAAATTEAPGAPSATPTLTPTTSCNYDSVFVTDVTIPDGTEVVSGAGFTKTWRIKNNGCLAWPSGTVLLFVEGNQMGGPTSVPVPATVAGGTQDVSVSLAAPATPGEHKGYWRLRSADGVQFGNKIYVTINAIAPTPTPTLIPTITLPPPVVTLPDLYVSEFSLTPATPVQDSPVHVRIGIYNKGTAAVTTPFVVRWYGGENFANVSCEWTINSMNKGGGQIRECDFTFSSWYPNINTKVVVDATGVIVELDETNNIFLKAISVAKP